MRRKRQLDLFDQVPKRGRKPQKPANHFGGMYLKNYNPKSKRPMDGKKALHLVLRSTKAKGEKSFKNKKHEAKIWDIISAHAERNGIKIHQYANSGNHLHLLIRAKYREDYARFIRTITGLIARAVCSSERGRPLKEKFWDARPFSRIVSYARREYKTVKAYLLRNTLEAIGWIPYFPRSRRLPYEIRQWLMPAPS